MNYLEKWPLISAIIINFIIALILHIIFKAVPAPEFSKINNIADRKELFFNFTYPLILSVNQHVKQERIRLLALQNKALPDYSDSRLIRVLAEKYDLTGNSLLDKPFASDEIIKQLLLRVDQIPPALVLAQAAKESAWGTSRFANKANNYFGIWCFKVGCGLVPKDRSKGKIHQVKRFSSVKNSIRYYIHLLNSHKSYKQLRLIRARQRVNGKPLTATDMAIGLTRYSQRGEGYVKELIALININQLAEKYPMH